MANRLQPTAGRPIIEFDATIFGEDISNCHLDHICRFGLKAASLKRAATYDIGNSNCS